MQKRIQEVLPILLYLGWVVIWGAAWRLLRHGEFSFSFRSVERAIWGGLGFLVGYYAFRKDASQLIDPRSPPQPIIDGRGYWRLRLDEELYDLCFATEREKERVPESSKRSGIGKIHCLVADLSDVSVDDEARVWVWLEWLAIPGSQRIG